MRCLHVPGARYHMISILKILAIQKTMSLRDTLSKNQAGSKLMLSKNMWYFIIVNCKQISTSLKYLYGSSQKNVNNWPKDKQNTFQYTTNPSLIPKNYIIHIQKLVLLLVWKTFLWSLYQCHWIFWELKYGKYWSNL